MTATNNDHDGHNHDYQLCEIYPMMLNELAIVFHVFTAVAIIIMVCGCRCLWLSWYRPVHYVNIIQFAWHVLLGLELQKSDYE